VVKAVIFFSRQRLWLHAVIEKFIIWTSTISDYTCSVPEFLQSDAEAKCHALTARNKITRRQKKVKNFSGANLTLFFNFHIFLTASFRLPPVKTPAPISFTGSLAVRFVTTGQTVSISEISQIKYTWMPSRIYEDVINVTSSFLSGRSLSRCSTQKFKLYARNANLRVVITL
jgi:hypothetical protein